MTIFLPKHVFNLSDLPPPPANAADEWFWHRTSAPLPDRMPDGRPWLRISIVTPSFNQAPFLEQAIRSVLLQGYPNLEYFILDGGSTDDSVAIIEKYAPFLTFWHSAPDGGQSDAINQGWHRATGDIVAWLNSDDYYEPDALCQIAWRFAQSPALGLVYGNLAIIDGHHRKFGPIGYRAGEREMLARLELPYQPASFFARALVERVGGLNPALKYTMDADLLLRLMSNAPFAYVPAALATFRIHDQSKTSLTENKFADELIGLLDEILRQPERYPALSRFGAQRLTSNFYRRASKHLYMSRQFRQSLKFIWRACLASPRAIPSILSDEGIGWLARHFLSVERYRALGYQMRTTDE